MEGAPKALIRLTHEAQGRSGDLSVHTTAMVQLRWFWLREIGFSAQTTAMVQLRCFYRVDLSFSVLTTAMANCDGFLEDAQARSTKRRGKVNEIRMGKAHIPNPPSLGQYKVPSLLTDLNKSALSSERILRHGLDN
jgi:hypothetical protein